MIRLDGRNEEHRRIYERSARLILLLALRDEMPGAKVRFEHSIGQGLYMTVEGVDLTATRVRALEKRMHDIVKKNLPIEKSRWTREEAHLGAFYMLDTPCEARCPGWPLDSLSVDMNGVSFADPAWREPPQLNWERENRLRSFLLEKLGLSQKD